jgi:hypothetical protein
MVVRTLFYFTFLLSSSLLFAIDEEKLAKSLDLDPVLEAHPYNFFGVTSMYANEPLTRQMLVIQDVDAELKETRFIEAKDFFIVEIPKDNKKYASFAFVGIKQEEVKPLITAPPTDTALTSLLRHLSLIPVSFANGICEVKGPSSFESIEALNNYYQTAYVQDTLKCLGQKLPPFRDNLDLLKKDPKAFWEKKLKELTNLLAFISLAPKSEKLCDFFKSLSRENLALVYGRRSDSRKIQKMYEDYLKKVSP